MILRKSPSSIIEYSSSHPALLEFQKTAAAMTQSRPTRNPLRVITAVGVPFNKDQGFLRQRDRAFTWGIFRGLHEAGLTVSPNFVFVPLDLNFGQDFLDPANARKTDVLALHFIAGINHPGRIFHLDSPGFKISPFDRGIDSWNNAAKKGSPKVMISYSIDRGDLNVSRFNQENRYQAYPQSHVVVAHKMSLLVDRKYAVDLKEEAAARPQGHPKLAALRKLASFLRHPSTAEN